MILSHVITIENERGGSVTFTETPDGIMITLNRNGRPMESVTIRRYDLQAASQAFLTPQNF